MNELVVDIPGELVGEVGRGRTIQSGSMTLVTLPVNVIFPIGKLAARSASTTYSSQLRIDLPPALDHIARMANLPKTELKKIARAASGRLLGAPRVKDVDVIGSDALD